MLFRSDTNDPLARVFISENPDVRAAIESGDSNAVRNLLVAAGISTMPMATDVLNAVDDSAYVTRFEAEQAFDSLGIDPDQAMLTYAMDLPDEDLESELAYYASEDLGMEVDSLSTGRTTAQHYDIIQHIQNMVDGVVPLDSDFNQNGEIGRAHV